MAMGSIISDETVEDIIRYRKYVKHDINVDDLPVSEDGRYRIKTYDLDCERYNCKMVIRQNTDRTDNFSIILVYKDPVMGDVPILRFNGNHGNHKNRIENEIIRGPHIHIMTERYQRHTTHPDGYAERTDLYRNIKEALESFMERANINNIKT